MLSPFDSILEGLEGSSELPTTGVDPKIGAPVTPAAAIEPTAKLADLTKSLRSVFFIILGFSDFVKWVLFPQIVSDGSLPIRAKSVTILLNGRCRGTVRIYR